MLIPFEIPETDPVQFAVDAEAAFPGPMVPYSRFSRGIDGELVTARVQILAIFKAVYPDDEVGYRIVAQYLDGHRAQNFAAVIERFRDADGVDFVRLIHFVSGEATGHSRTLTTEVLELREA